MPYFDVRPDESSAALDYEATERLFAKMREMKAGGCAIFIVTHRIAELVRIADRATVLRDGRSVGTLEKSQITEDNIMNLIAGADRKKADANASFAKKSSECFFNWVLSAISLTSTKLSGNVDDVFSAT